MNELTKDVKVKVGFVVLGPQPLLQKVEPRNYTYHSSDLLYWLYLQMKISEAVFTSHQEAWIRTRPTKRTDKYNHIRQTLLRLLYNQD